MNNNININLILEKIKSLENNNSSLRKVTKNDLNNTKNYLKKQNKNDCKVKDYRMQEEHGEKKFIKP